MPSLLIIAHGSRRAASNDEVRALADAVRAQPGQAYAHVATAFLELAEPSIPDGLAALAAQGATEIVAFPYFLAAGTHVAQDIPEAIAEFSATHPAVELRLTPHLGASAVLPAAILSEAA
jgi:sirohydrochlorin ferrochelatase